MALSGIDSQLKSLYEAIPMLEIDRSNLLELREAFLKTTPPSTDGIERKEIKEDDVSGILFSKDGVKSVNSPLIVWFHGGGFRTGGPSQGICLCEKLASEGMRVFAARYRLAPECPFPAALNDSHRVWDWATGPGLAKYGLVPTSFGLWGISAGAGLAASLTLKLRDLEHHVQPSVLVLTTPWVARPPAGTEISSWQTVTQTKLWGLKGAIVAASWYEPEEKDDQGYAFAEDASSLADLPPTIVSVAELDILRDSGITFAKRLMNESGRSVSLQCYPGTFHGSVALVPAADVSVRQVADEIRFAKAALGI